jgi:hypothetical protein
VQRAGLDVLTGEPALASLRWHGRQLDAPLVIIGIVVARLLAGSAVLLAHTAHL